MVDQISRLAVPPLSALAGLLDGPAPWAAKPLNELVARLQGT